jgi:serine/threonine-protein kinase
MPQGGSLTGHLLDGRYRVGTRIGHGGFGAVYEAVDENDDTIVAVKVLDVVERLSPSRARQAQERFRRESAVMQRLRGHPNIVSIYSTGYDRSLGLEFIAMERLYGHDLREHLPRGTRLSIPDAMEILNGVARALAAAHSAGVIHRDLKPGNIYIRSQPQDGERVVVMDFGIAFWEETAEPRVTAFGEMPNTPLYASPEQYAGAVDQVHAPTDVFSFGVVAYEVLTGKLPFNESAVVRGFQGGLGIIPPQTHHRAIPDSLAQVIGWCLQLEPKDRIRDGVALEKILRRVAPSSKVVPPEIDRIFGSSSRSDGGRPVHGARPRGGTRVQETEFVPQAPDHLHKSYRTDTQLQTGRAIQRDADSTRTAHSAARGVRDRPQGATPIGSRERHALIYLVLIVAAMLGAVQLGYYESGALPRLVFAALFMGLAVWYFRRRRSRV